MENMFCFQCEQTAKGVACDGNAGVCGKKKDTANLQDELTGALIALAHAAKDGGRSRASDEMLLEGLFTTVTNVSFDDPSIEKLIEKAHQLKARILQNREDISDYNMNILWKTEEDVRSLKSLILFGIRGMAAYAYHAYVLGFMNEEVTGFFYKALRIVGGDWEKEELLPVVMETGAMNLKCMEILDRANTETYGTPVPTTVPMTIERGPFIVVSGHDLHDLKLLLEQTEGKGINIYTHGEMLPAHGYPKLKSYRHLKGNFGTAWQSQQKEFENIPAPVLFTTNCLMPVGKSYHDRIFTTAAVAYPEMVHIGKDKDFTPVIRKALELGGYPKDHPMTGINGGTEVTTGFGHGAVLSVADTVIKGINSGEIRHFFLVGGCDGAAPGRNYYTEFVKKTPKDTIVLTVACGKFRFNDLDIGTIAGIPRILDMGQCNDSYSAIKVAVALAEALECNIHALPLTMVLSWYEQKAVAVLLTLLYLGIKNILLGPSLPAFISPSILQFLVDTFGIGPISTPEEDLKKILG